MLGLPVPTEIKPINEIIFPHVDGGECEFPIIGSPKCCLSAKDGC